jgi:dienelactone hydrolase
MPSRPATADAHTRAAGKRRSRAGALAFALGATLALTLPPTGARAHGITSVPAANGRPEIPVYLARPRDDKRHPAVVLLHGCQGFDGLYAVAADRLAARGYVVAALDSLGPGNPNGACGGDVDGSIAEAADARATLAWVRTLPYVEPDRLALIGGSMGGYAVLDIIDPAVPGAALPAGLKAAITYYPDCEGRSGNTLVPLAIFDGDADRITPAAPCAALAKAAQAAGKTLEITTFPGATHGFDIPGPQRTTFGEPIRFDPDATRVAAEKTLAFLQRYLN